ncbi:hypothetical protein CAEBREN_21295 [Caenorhabditis brenneri]|uniref:PHD-type domain-containing protein n=1 Tax=Caenorhabditis brenneri TaxID=135651 RepID=G0PGS3_CAEBE|nr:hypothetical protein CAEBREN_21295 [Caenorhabditis brenneri]
MSDSEDSSIIIVEEPEAPPPSAPTAQEPFEANEYIAKLIGFMRSTEQDANQKFSELVAKTWARPSDASTNFCTDAYSLDTGGVSKPPQNVAMNAQKRIAGTQRLMYPPPPMTKLGAPPTASTVQKKVKKQMPVIDDSIYCTTDQACKTCDGVSLSGNQVLMCKGCRDCYHMKCSIPPVSVEEASDPKFVYHCKTCLVSKKVMSSASRSRSPSPAVIEAKKMKMAKKI